MLFLLTRLVMLCLSFLLLLLPVELALRFLPVDDGLVAEPVNGETPIFRFRADRTQTWSRGPFFEQVNEIRVNNAGFVNNQDYVAADGLLTAVVGDSYVEAAMVPFADTLHGRLAARSDAPVYSFAASGAPLSQYVVWADHARQDWGADALVVVIIGNDFDESLLSAASQPGFHYYTEDGVGGLALARLDYQPGRWRDVVLHSALARYLLFNLQVLHHLQALSNSLAAWADTPEFAGNTSTSTDPVRVERSTRAIDAFLADLQAVAGWMPAEVVFVVDGFRYPDAAEAGAGTFFDLMRRHFMAEATDRGFGVIDMDAVFFPAFAAAGDRFDIPNDGHWNARAHGLAADAVAALLPRSDPAPQP